MTINPNLSEITGTSAEKLNLKTAKDFYRAEILKLPKFPENPEQLPTKTNIPIEAIGDLENAILRTMDSGKETSQSVFWNTRNGFRKTRLFEGTKSQTGVIATVTEANLALFGEKSILAYHTHPKSFWNFSNHDIAGSTTSPRRTYIDIVGSDRAIIGLFQTEPSTKLPFFAVYKGFATKRYLDEERFQEIGQLKKLADIVGKLGYGLYYWLPPSGTFQEGDLKNGLPMKKA